MRVFKKKHLKVRETPFPYQEYDNSSDEMTHTFRLTSTQPDLNHQLNQPRCLDSSSFEVHPFHHHFVSLEALLGRYSNSPESRSSKCSLSSHWCNTRISSGFFWMAWFWVFFFVVTTYDRCPFQVEPDNEMLPRYLRGVYKIRKKLGDWYTMEPNFYVPGSPENPFWGTWKWVQRCLGWKTQLH